MRNQASALRAAADETRRFLSSRSITSATVPGGFFQLSAMRWISPYTTSGARSICASRNVSGWTDSTVPRRQGFRGEVFDVECHDHLGFGAERRGQDVAVVLVGSSSMSVSGSCPLTRQSRTADFTSRRVLVRASGARSGRLASRLRNVSSRMVSVHVNGDEGHRLHHSHLLAELSELGCCFTTAPVVCLLVLHERRRCDSAVRSDWTALDFACVQEADEEGPGHVEDVCRLPGGELRGTGDDGHASTCP